MIGETKNVTFLGQFVQEDCCQYKAACLGHRGAIMISTQTTDVQCTGTCKHHHPWAHCFTVQRLIWGFFCLAINVHPIPQPFNPLDHHAGPDPRCWTGRPLCPKPPRSVSPTPPKYVILVVILLVVSSSNDLQVAPSRFKDGKTN